jgi:hypothetical protein
MDYLESRIKEWYLGRMPLFQLDAREPSSKPNGHVNRMDTRKVTASPVYGILWTHCCL